MFLNIENSTIEYFAVMLIAVVPATALFILFDTITLYIKKRKFKKDFKLAVINNQPTWEEVLTIIQNIKLPKNNALEIIKFYRSEIIVGREKELAQYKKLINTYFESSNIKDPLENFPIELRSNINHIKVELKNNDKIIEPLVYRIGEMIEFNSSKNRKQRFYTLAGFLFGLISIAPNLLKLFS